MLYVNIKFKDSKVFPKTLYDANICNLCSHLSHQAIPCQRPFILLEGENNLNIQQYINACLWIIHKQVKLIEKKNRNPSQH